MRQVYERQSKLKVTCAVENLKTTSSFRIFVFLIWLNNFFWSADYLKVVFFPFLVCLFVYIARAILTRCIVFKRFERYWFPYGVIYWSWNKNYEYSKVALDYFIKTAVLSFKVVKIGKISTVSLTMSSNSFSYAVRLVSEWPLLGENRCISQIINTSNYQLHL